MSLNLKIIIHPATTHRLVEISKETEEMLKNLEEVTLSLSLNSTANIKNHLERYQSKSHDDRFFVTFLKNNPEVLSRYRIRLDKVYSDYQAFINQKMHKVTDEMDKKSLELLGLTILAIDQILIQNQ